MRILKPGLFQAKMATDRLKTNKDRQRDKVFHRIRIASFKNYVIVMVIVYRTKILIDVFLSFTLYSR